MSGALDKRARALAERLLKKFGKKGTITLAGVLTYNDDTGQTTYSMGDPVSITYYIDSKKTMQGRVNNLINHDEIVILISTKELGTDLVEQSTIIINDIETTITRFDSVWSGEKVAIYEAVAVV